MAGRSKVKERKVVGEMVIERPIVEGTLVEKSANGKNGSRKICSRLHG